MKLYDYISQQNVEVSSTNKTVKMYVCGPTVYNHVHIGNLRPIITFDVLNRLLIELGYKVIFIHNITDIDDKIINKALQEQKTEFEIAEFYEKKYLEILDVLNIHKQNMLFPKVSTHIKDIENYIKKIMENNFAYFKNGDVYFNTLKSNQYGTISNKKIDDLLIGEKSQLNSNKNNSQDFVLWKKTDIGLNWETEFSQGRPGWHTECACLINKYLGVQTDIHGGGVDLKFPHHENENIQNIAVVGKPLARIWMHVGHLNINNEKMSKSLQNFILAKDLLKTESANTIRWFFYQTNFSNPLNFTTENLNNSKNELESIIYSLNVFKSYLIIENKFKDLLNFKKEYIFELENSFNFPNQISFILQKIKNGHTLLKQKKYEELNELLFNTSYLLKNILGIIYPNIHNNQEITMLKEWDDLKNKKEFKKSDAIREKLIEKKLL
ncbi:MAG: cysteine--tRNA ligase [Malacoplasma sp.]|nr:cysteine--tRNA ligase [Malacoplasma sp.]